MMSERCIQINLVLLGIILFIALLPTLALADNELSYGGIAPSNNLEDIVNPPCVAPAAGGDPVCLKEGEYHLNVQDLSVQGRVLPVTFKRYYSSVSEYNGRLGYGWDWNYNIRLRPLADGNTIMLLTGENRNLEYKRDNPENSVFDPPAGIQGYLLENTDGTYTLLRKHGTEMDFDENGNLTAIFDRNNNSITFDYEDVNGVDKIFTLQGPSKFFVSEEFGGPPDGRGVIAMSYRLKSITDDLGRDVNMYYDSNGLLTDINDFAGRNWHYTYDVNNDLTAVTNPTGLVTQYTYDPNHNLVNIVDPNGDTYLTNRYNENDEVYEQDYGYDKYVFDYYRGSNYVVVTDREGFTTTHYYNDYGNLVKKSTTNDSPRAGEPTAYITRYDVDPNLIMVTKKIFPAGNYIDSAYDSNANLLEIAMEPNDGDANIVTRYQYDPNWHFVTEINDPMGNITTFDYNDATGNLELITYPEVNYVDETGTEVTGEPNVVFTYTEYGQLETITAPDGIVTKFEYYTGCDPNTDPNCGKLWKIIVDYNVVDGCNITIEYKYDWYSNVVEVKDPNGDITTYAYNALNLPTQITSPTDDVVKFKYSNNKKLSQIERLVADDPNQITTYAYDLLDNLKSITDPCNYTTTYAYSKNEDVNSVIDANDGRTNYFYDERGLLIKAVDANGDSTLYGYTANGDINDITDAHGNITRYEYDGFDRFINIIYPDDSNEQFKYDDNSNIISKTNRAGQTVGYKYDALNRLIDVNRPGGDPNIIYRYDISGRIGDANDLRLGLQGGGLTSFTYDRIGRATDINDIAGRKVSYEYNDKGLRTKLTYPDGNEATYEYDASSRLTGIKYDGSFVARYQYDDLGRRKLLTLGTNGDVNVVYEYKLNNRLTRVANNINDVNLTYTYTNYDAVGNRLSMKINDANAHLYEYDKLYQLTCVDYNDGNETWYAYDALGNRYEVNESGDVVVYDVNGLNQYTYVGPSGNQTHYDYDKNGNLSDDGTYLYYYDYANRLTDVNNQNDQPVVSYEYDYHGRRVRKYVHGTQQTIVYCYDGDRVIAEYDENGELLCKYVYGPGIDEPVCMIDVTGQSEVMYYYHFDGLGSVIALSNENSEIVERYSYDAYGEPNHTSSVGNPYLFTARRYDNETGLYYYRARYYSPEIGRFLQRDPIGYIEGMNLYTYVRNNPVNAIDPLGWCKDSSSGDDPRSIWERWYGYWHNIGYNWESFDAITISVSGAYFTGGGFGGGGGIEAVYIFGQGWVIYGQAGGGGGIPGGGGALEIGPIFNLEKPSDYTGIFIEVQGGYAPQGIGVSGSWFWSPDRGLLHLPSSEAPWGVKGGLYVGTPSLGVIGESYDIFCDFTD